MQTPPGPQNLESLKDRPFSFYPPVINIEHNEWVYDKGTWSEVLVTNTKTKQEVWVPRRFLGEVSRVDEPVMIVGLKRELEYKAGSLWPYERRVIEMPKAVNDYARAAPQPDPPGRLSAVTGMPTGSNSTDAQVSRMLIIAFGVGVLVIALAFLLIRGRSRASDVTFVPILQQTMGLTPFDDYYGILRKLGQPKEDRWKSGSGEIEYRALHYPDRQVHVILMGKDRESARYIGALDEHWKVVDSVELPNAGNTRSMLSQLPRF